MPAEVDRKVTDEGEEWRVHETLRLLNDQVSIWGLDGRFLVSSGNFMDVFGLDPIPEYLNPEDDSLFPVEARREATPCPDSMRGN